MKRYNIIFTYFKHIFKNTLVYMFMNENRKFMNKIRAKVL